MRGFSTLEMLIAMAILITALSAVAPAAFGTQSMLGAGEMNAAALRKAQALLEKEKSAARKDPRLLHAIPPESDGTYETSVSVSDWQFDPYTTKRITARAAWTDEHKAGRDVVLTALVSDFRHADTGDTCDPFLSGDWAHPRIVSFDLNALVATSSGAYQVSGVDAYRGKLYVTAVRTAYKTDPTFFIFDTADPTHLRLLSALDNDSASALGPAGVAVSGRFAYLANTSRPASAGQLQIFDVSDPSAPSLVKNFPLTGNGGAGASIFYTDGSAYLGLTKNGTNPEFAAVDVHDPARPALRGTYTVGASVEAIYVRNGYAYLATDDPSRELIVLDVSDPSAPIYAGAYDAYDAGFGDGFGRSIYTVGDTLYLGRTYISGAPELYALDISDLASIPDPPLGSSDIGPNNANPYGVYGVIARDYLAFVLTKAGSGGQLRVLDVSDPKNIFSVASSTLPSASGGVSLDCEGNVMYAGSTDASNNGYLSVIGAGP